MTAKERFDVTEELWGSYFAPPLEGRAELWDYNDKVALSVWRDGVKVWEQRNNDEGSLNSDVVKALADGVLNTL